MTLANVFRTRGDDLRAYFRATVPERVRVQLGRCLPWLLVLALLAFMDFPALQSHMRLSWSRDYFNDDVRQQIFPFFRYSDSRLFRNDYIADYFLANMPVGYRFLYTVGAWLWDAERLSKLLPYLLLAVVLISVALTTKRLGGVWAAGASLAIALGSSVYLARMTGGLPRSFGFPIVAAAMVALVHARVYALAVVVCVGASLYPAAAVPAGLCLALLLLVWPSADRGPAQKWSFQHRALVVSATAAFSVVLLVPTALGGRKFGQVITPSMQDEFPEIGPGGRYLPEDRAPFSGFFTDALPLLEPSLIGSGEPWSASMQQKLRAAPAPANLEVALTDFLLAVTIGGWLVLASRRSEARRLLLLPVCALAGHLLARYSAPYFYLPQRYVLYTAPLLVSVMVPAALAGWVELWAHRRHELRQAGTLGICLLLLILIGKRGDPRAGLTARASASEPLLQAIGRLPPDALIAGWPGGVADYIPYVARRRMLLTYETHQAFHTGYALEMRRRMRALIDAYFAASLEPVLELRRNFGVTHLMIHLPYLRGRAPAYFLPFREWIRDARRLPGAGSSEMAERLASAAVFRYGDDMVVALDKLADPVGPPTLR